MTTTTALTGTPTSGAFGTPVTFTATVRAVRGDTPPDGTNAVTVKNGTTTLGTANLVSGTVTFLTSTLPPGNSVTATYSGGTNYATSTSNAVSVNITPIACVVTSTADPSESGKLTLRGAIYAANAGACTGNTITFALTAFPATTPTTITLGSTVTITGTVTIDGMGHQVTIDGGGTTRLFTVNGGATLAVNALTLTGSNSAGAGGGIFNSAGGTVTVTNSTLRANSAPYGGGIFNNGGMVTVTNSTISGNSAGKGGGILNNGTLTLTNSTVSGNSATSDGGGIFNSSGMVNAANTLIVNNPGGDVAGNGINGTSTHNLTGSFTFATPLQNNGGPTQTLALPPGSPAIAHGDPTVCAQSGAGKVNGLDQRGVARPRALCAIGAFEPLLSAISPSSGSVTGGGTVTLIGTGFAAGATVSIGGVRCTNVQVVSSMTMTCTVGGHAAGTVDVVVTVGSMTGTLTGGYTYGVVVNPLPRPSPTGGTTGVPNPLPGSRPTGTTGGVPNPLPPARP